MIKEVTRFSVPIVPVELDRDLNAGGLRFEFHPKSGVVRRYRLSSSPQTPLYKWIAEQNSNHDIPTCGCTMTHNYEVADKGLQSILHHYAKTFSCLFTSSGNVFTYNAFPSMAVEWISQSDSIPHVTWQYNHVTLCTVL